MERKLTQIIPVNATNPTKSESPWQHCRKDIHPLNNQYSSTPEVLFQNRWTKNTEGALADPGSPGKRPVKWSGASDL